MFERVVILPKDASILVWGLILHMCLPIFQFFFEGFSAPPSDHIGSVPGVLGLHFRLESGTSIPFHTNLSDTPDPWVFPVPCLLTILDPLWSHA